MAGLDVTHTLEIFSVLLTEHAITHRAILLKRRQHRRYMSSRTPSVRRDRRTFAKCTQYSSNVKFARTFCLPRHAFSSLLEVLRAELSRNIIHARRSSGGGIKPAVRLAIAMRMLAGASYLDLATNYNVSLPFVYSSFHDVISSVYARLSMPGIPLRDASAPRKLALGFQRSRSRPIPLIECTRALYSISIRLMKPHSGFICRKFFCRKGMYSIPVQAVMSSDYKFIYMSAMCAGSTNDCLAYSVRRLARRLRTENLLDIWVAVRF